MEYEVVPVEEEPLSDDRSIVRWRSVYMCVGLMTAVKVCVLWWLMSTSYPADVIEWFTQMDD